MAEGLEEPFASILSKQILVQYDSEGCTHIYGPGSSFSALKHRHVSSVKTGPPISKSLALEP